MEDKERLLSILNLINEIEHKRLSILLLNGLKQALMHLESDNITSGLTEEQINILYGDSREQ